MNMTTCYLGRGLPQYFLHKSVASGEDGIGKLNICRARMEATKTLGLAVMEIKLNIFFEQTQCRTD